jgi:hypothetical protein
MGETLLGSGDSVDRAVTWAQEGDATVILLERVVGWEPIANGTAPVWEVMSVTRLPGRFVVLLDCEVAGTLDPWVVAAAAADAECGAAVVVAHAYRGTPSSAELSSIPTGNVRCPSQCDDDPLEIPVDRTSD